MIGLLRKADAWLLGRGDWAMTWLVHEAGLPRRMVVRMALLVWIVLGCASVIEDHSASRGWELALFSLPLVLNTVVDFRLGDLPPEAIRLRRETPVMRGVRMVLIPWVVFDFGMDLLSRTPLDVAETIAFAAFIVLSDSVPRPKPPRRVREARRLRAPA